MRCSDVDFLLGERALQQAAFEGLSGFVLLSLQHEQFLLVLSALRVPHLQVPSVQLGAGLFVLWREKASRGQVALALA